MKGRLKSLLSPESRIHLEDDELILLRGEAMRGRGALGAANWGQLLLTDRRIMWRSLAPDIDVALTDVTEVRSAGFLGQLLFNGPNLEVRTRAGETLRFGMAPDSPRPDVWVESVSTATRENAVRPKTFSLQPVAPTPKVIPWRSLAYLTFLVAFVTVTIVIAKVMGLG